VKGKNVAAYWQSPQYMPNGDVRRLPLVAVFWLIAES
jgi:hypothetical protein